MIKLTNKQCNTLDKAVLTAIENAHQPRAVDLARTPAVVEIINTLPKEKADFRYLDNSLQRLRKQGWIEATRGSRWRVIRGRP